MALKLTDEKDASQLKRLAASAYHPHEGENPPRPAMTMTNAGTVLMARIEAIEHIKDEMRSFSEDIKEIMKDLKAEGFDMKVVRDIMRLRRMDDPREHIKILETYCAGSGLRYFADE